MGAGAHLTPTQPNLNLEIRPAHGPRRRRTVPAARARAWLRKLRGGRVAVVGDAMLDAFLWGDATRISPEAPVPVVLLERQTWSLGGAANVAANVRALGGEAELFAAIGDDAEGERLWQLLREAGVGTAGVVRVAGRATTVKHRVFASNKHLLRFDREQTTPFAPAVIATLARRLRAAAGLNAVVISDYGKGGVTPPLVRAVERAAVAAHLPLCVDPKDGTLRFRHASVLKPNLVELELLSGMRVDGEAALERAAARLLRRQGCERLLVTRGRDGMALFDRHGGSVWLDGGGQQVADVTGAGDTVTGALALGLAARLPPYAAALVANLAAGYVVSLPGTATARQSDLLAMLAD